MSIPLLIPVIVLWFYALVLPDFRMSQFLGGCAVLIPMFVYFVSVELGLTNPSRLSLSPLAARRSG